MAILLKRRHLFQTIVFGYPSFFFSGVYLYSRNPVTWLKTTICIEFLNVIPWGFVTSWPGWFLQKSGWTPAQQNSFFFSYFIGHEPRIREDEPISMAHGSWNVKGFRLVVAHIARNKHLWLALVGWAKTSTATGESQAAFRWGVFFSETESRPVCKIGKPQV